METTNETVVPVHYNPNQLVTYKVINGTEVSYPTDKVTTIEYNLDLARRSNDRANNLQSTINKIIDNMTADYWYNPNTDKETILSDLCDILDYTPKKEISFDAVIHFSGRIEIDLADAEDFDLNDMLSDAYVDINHGDVVIDNYELYSADEV